MLRASLKSPRRTISIKATSPQTAKVHTFHLTISIPYLTVQVLNGKTILHQTRIIMLYLEVRSVYWFE
jgi:hypothetical protein